MKNLRFYVLLIMLPALLFSCGKDKDKVDDVVGTWAFQRSTLSSVRLNGTALPASLFADFLDADDLIAPGTTLEIKADGTFAIRSSDGDDSGRWTLSADRRELAFTSASANVDVIIFQVKALQSSVMILTLQTEESGFDPSLGGSFNLQIEIDLEFIKR